jgi:hypothetical protein
MDAATFDLLVIGACIFPGRSSQRPPHGQIIRPTGCQDDDRVDLFRCHHEDLQKAKGCSRDKKKAQ